MKQQIVDKDQANEQKDAEIAKINAEKEELARELAEARKMLAQTSGHQVMTKQIDRQKKTTRDALSYVAELKRERSIFHTPSKSITDQFDSISQVDPDDLNTSHIEEEKAQERKAKLMELLEKSETKH